MLNQNPQNPINYIITAIEKIIKNAIRVKKNNQRIQ